MAMEFNQAFNCAALRKSSQHHSGDPLPFVASTVPPVPLARVPACRKHRRMPGVKRRKACRRDRKIVPATWGRPRAAKGAYPLIFSVTTCCADFM